MNINNNYSRVDVEMKPWIYNSFLATCYQCKAACVDSLTWLVNCGCSLRKKNILNMNTFKNLKKGHNS